MFFPLVYSTCTIGYRKKFLVINKTNISNLLQSSTPSSILYNLKDSFFISQNKSKKFPQKNLISNNIITQRKTIDRSLSNQLHHDSIFEQISSIDSAAAEKSIDKSPSKQLPHENISGQISLIDSAAAKKSIVKSFSKQLPHAAAKKTIDNSFSKQLPRRRMIGQISHIDSDAEEKTIDKSLSKQLPHKIFFGQASPVDSAAVEKTIDESSLKLHGRMFGHISPVDYAEVQKSFDVHQLRHENMLDVFSIKKEKKTLDERDYLKMKQNKIAANMETLDSNRRELKSLGTIGTSMILKM